MNHWKRKAQPGAVGYYRMLGSVHVGEPVHATDTAIAGSGRRDVLLRGLDVLQQQKDKTNDPKDSPTGRD